MDINKLVRKNILELKPYSSARSEFKGDASIWLDANENPYGSPLSENYNRYPDPLQVKLKEKIASIKGVTPEQVCVGNGSDELMDYIVRIFCEPGQDSVIVSPPTFRMYEVASSVNNNKVIKVLLEPDFQLDADRILESAEDHTKIIFICSPNNPTGNNMNPADVEKILNNFSGIVVVDEAYIDFSQQASFMGVLSKHKNLIIIQTLSKIWGLAGLRIGFAFAHPDIIQLMTNIKMPYNINKSSQDLTLKALDNQGQIAKWKDEILQYRESLWKEFTRFDFIEEIYPTDANFILVRVKDATKLYQYLLTKGIVVRNQSSQPMLENCVRIAVGTGPENELLIEALNEFSA